MSTKTLGNVIDANGSCEVRIGRKDLTTIKDCECSVEIDFPIGRCSVTQCRVDEYSIFEDAKIHCICAPECPDMLYYLV
jgi:hypothetical protein